MANKRISKTTTHAGHRGLNSFKAEGKGFSQPPTGLGKVPLVKKGKGFK